MSDIALLLAEDYEKIVAEKFKIPGEGESIMQVSGASIKVHIPRLKENVMMVENRELFKRVCEPKTQISIAALNNLFSA